MATSLQSKHAEIYRMLSEMREAFHSYGRLDDSNAKLDEVAKLFATYIAYKQGRINRFPTGNELTVVELLQNAFLEACALPQYRDQKGCSIFGIKPSLALQEADGVLAQQLVRVTRHCVDTAFENRSGEEPFDVLNEAFGHFVRDNFRGNVEDAQYMTPAEVVNFMVEMALHDFGQEQPEGPLVILDPTCGVGSFLGSFYSAALREGYGRSKLRLFGQDKVERMVRLSTINMELFDAKDHKIYSGNSLEKGGGLDELNGSVDLILTNPPFGARIDRAQLNKSIGDNAPFFSSTGSSVSNVDSELLFIDRNLRLLKPGGRLMIVVPDGVVSARGMSAMLRKHLAETCSIEAIIELPPTAFAQAGTRTKTVILYLRKRRQNSHATFIAVAGDLGFQVSSRKGVQIKSYEGTNELESILQSFKVARSFLSRNLPNVVASQPSCVLVAEKEIVSGSWTPSHYSAKRFQAIGELSATDDVEVVKLSDLAEFHSDRKASAVWTDGSAFLSVLHILGEGFIDVIGARCHAPKTAGLLTQPGDVLISKINPRIPRVAVTPDFGMRTLCSSEFEVLRPRGRISSYALAYLLQTKLVQDQVQSLTSGTSASHNRIRSKELATVTIPIPKKGSKSFASFHKIVREYESAATAMVDATMKLSELRMKEGDLMSAGGGNTGRGGD
ncbi:N-6 DNA methylase [Stenotrophomonas maltophilia]|uniref:N-6 DNA methylase n=1 Tax=Stenotrophomonas maltophilia TaxID=40324 RepID=UPI000DAA25F7|nr:N-6 DNA methylase [Stenotrophomonas maltophilia]